MIHDQDLVDQLSALTVERFDGEVFRATGVSANPLAFSLNGGRWAPAAGDGTDVPVLYTSMERDGALADNEDTTSCTQQPRRAGRRYGALRGACRSWG
jgi:hypothetical protein